MGNVGPTSFCAGEWMLRRYYLGFAGADGLFCFVAVVLLVIIGSLYLDDNCMFTTFGD